MYIINFILIKDFNIKISLRNPIKGGKPIFKILKIKIIIKKIKDTDINFTTNKDRVFHHANKPINQNIRGDKNP